MGIVWRATDERLERAVAIKQILTQQGLSEDERANVRQRAMREARNAARFQHPNAIVVFDITEHDGDPCLVMEYLPAQSLSTILAEREILPVPEVCRIGEQIAAALLAAHRAGLVHRDIKPGNILIDDHGTCKITDFGISRASGDLTLTQTGMIGGTPAYLAPELARGADPKPSSDVFSLGATLYHAIEGLPPYGDNTNQFALLYAAASANINQPVQSGPAAGLLMNLMRADPDERPSMQETRDQLARIAGGGSSGGAPGTPAPAPPARTETTAVDKAGAGRFPWQRNGSSVGGTTTHAPSPPGGSDPNRNSSGRGGRRKKLLISAISAGVLALAAITTAVVFGTQDEKDSPEQQAQPPSSTAPPTTSQPTITGNPDNPVNLGAAGQQLVKFYGKPQDNWDLLSPESQEHFGDEDEFQEYWEDFKPKSIRRAEGYKEDHHRDDGSVDMRVHVDFGKGLEPMYLNVVQSSDGGLLIRGDPRQKTNTRP